MASVVAPQHREPSSQQEGRFKESLAGVANLPLDEVRHACWGGWAAVQGPCAVGSRRACSCWRGAHHSTNLSISSLTSLAAAGQAEALRRDGGRPGKRLRLPLAATPPPRPLHSPTRCFSPCPPAPATSAHPPHPPPASWALPSCPPNLPRPFPHHLHHPHHPHTPTRYIGRPSQLCAGRLPARPRGAGEQVCGVSALLLAGAPCSSLPSFSGVKSSVPAPLLAASASRCARVPCLPSPFS